MNNEKKQLIGEYEDKLKKLSQKFDQDLASMKQ